MSIALNRFSHTLDLIVIQMKSTQLTSILRINSDFHRFNDFFKALRGPDLKKSCGQ
jgi:hypothetical protein